MNPVDIFAKANAVANSVLDILRKEWFLSLLLWLLLVTELNGIWSGRSIQSVLRATVLEDFGWTLFEPVIDGMERLVRVIAGHDIVLVAAAAMLGILVLCVLISFLHDGRYSRYTEIGELASLNLMLRFTIITTLAATTGSKSALACGWIFVALVYAFGAALGAESGRRAGAFVFGVVRMSLLGIMTLLSPFVLVTVALWRVCAEPIR